MEMTVRTVEKIKIIVEVCLGSLFESADLGKKPLYGNTKISLAVFKM